jgi:hypothetical protein
MDSAGGGAGLGFQNLSDSHRFAAWGFDKGLETSDNSSLIIPGGARGNRLEYLK